MMKFVAVLVGALPLVQSTQMGLRLAPDSLISVRQQDGVFQTNGRVVSAQWCNHALTECVDAWEHPECTTDECVRVELVYVPVDHEPVFVQGLPDVMVTFAAVGVGGEYQEGSWCGPADFNFDGVVDSGDLFAFLAVFHSEQGDCDYNVDGTTNSQDLFDFITDLTS